MLSPMVLANTFGDFFRLQFLLQNPAAGAFIRRELLLLQRFLFQQAAQFIHFGFSHAALASSVHAEPIYY